MSFHQRTPYNDKSACDLNCGYATSQLKSLKSDPKGLIACPFTKENPITISQLVTSIVVTQHQINK